MNLMKKPTSGQLKTLLAQANDSEGHHILWVDKSGEVNLTLLPHGASPGGWSEHYGHQIQCRYETYERSGDFVGKTVAADKAYVKNLFLHLIGDWDSRKQGCLA
jgi:hypothetical protein